MLCAFSTSTCIKALSHLMDYLFTPHTINLSNYISKTLLLTFSVVQLSLFGVLTHHF